MLEKSELLSTLNNFEVGLNGDDVKVNFLARVDDFKIPDSVTTAAKSWDNSSLSFDWYEHNYRPYVEKYYYPYYPTVVSTTVKEDKFEKAFTIAKKLLKTDMLNSKRLPDFIQLVEMIASEI
jgi:hypothetical protein